MAASQHCIYFNQNVEMLGATWDRHHNLSVPEIVSEPEFTFWMSSVCHFKNFKKTQCSTSVEYKVNTYCQEKREYKWNLNDPPARPESWERQASMFGYLNPTLSSNLILRVLTVHTDTGEEIRTLSASCVRAPIWSAHPGNTEWFMNSGRFNKLKR